MVFSHRNCNTNFSRAKCRVHVVSKTDIIHCFLSKYYARAFLTNILDSQTFSAHTSNLATDEIMGNTQYCLNCKQYVKPIRNYKNIRGRQGIGTFVLGKLKPKRCPICLDSNFSKVAPVPEPIQVKETKEIITKEVVMIPCKYCKSLMPQTSLFCSSCGASHKS